MKKGECLEEEKEEYKRHLEGECKSNSSSIGEMDIDQRKRVEEELKALKEKKDQDAQVLVKRGGRPPSTSKVESSMKDKNILGYHSLSQKKATKGAYVYIPLANFHSLHAKSSIKEVNVWNYDYIALGKEFTKGDFKGGFAVMREFFISLERGEKIRNSKPCTWSVDLIVIDLSTGDSIDGSTIIPSWNVLTEDHVKFSILVASTIVDDMGWILVLCPLSSIALVERMGSCAGLVVGLRWIVDCLDPYASSKKYSHSFKMTAFATLALHKNGVSPFINMERGHKVETLLQQNISSQIIGHCMPTLSRAQRDGKSGGWRGVLERSASYMLLFMEALCPPMGTVLEIGDGTRHVLKAAMHTGCCCMSIDDDKDICDAYLTPFIIDFYGNPRVSKMQDLGVFDSDDDGDFVLNEAPLDYEFPSYTEAMARHMESNPYYNRLLVQHQRSKQCIFIDDEVDFD
ncbi:hypothetical protein L7F22_041559 [Adiantum nelumboides]|nr:hypothetical protein [Adiantum nelumboides]